MTYQDLGYTDTLEKHRIEQNLDSFEVGRIVAEHKERYVVKTPLNEYDSELIGNLRFTAESRYDFPAICPRISVIERHAVGEKGQVQIIATNIDFGLIVQAVDRDFNLNDCQEYLLKII